MSITLAGVTIVAAGLCQATIVSGLSLSTTSLLLLMLAASILLRGKYHYLERAAKVLVVLLSLITVATTLLALPGINWSDSGHLMPESWDIKTILFAIALVGWMPTTLDASIWQSLWTVEKVQESGKNISAKNRSLDFHIGFVGTGVLAICFCLIGASIMHGNGITFSNTAAGFSAQLIDMYAKTLGEWSRPVIGFSALAVMFSTVLTVVDGYPRALSSLIAIIKAPKDARTVENDNGPAADNTYSYIVVFQVLAAYILISYWAHSFTGLIDIAASIAFMSAPFIAFFNHRAMRSNAISPQYRLSGPHYVASLVSICLLSAFALICIYYMTI